MVQLGHVLLQVCLIVVLCSRTLRTRPLNRNQNGELRVLDTLLGSWSSTGELRGSGAAADTEELRGASAETEAEEVEEEEEDSVLESSEAYVERVLGSMKSQLLRELNLSSVPQWQSRVQPPDFMMQLYNRYASDTSHTPRADVIRSFSVQDVTLSETHGSISRHRLVFNVLVPASERISSAQLRLHTHTGPRTHMCPSEPATAATIRVYQLEKQMEPHRLRENTRDEEHRTETEQTEGGVFIPPLTENQLRMRRDLGVMDIHTDQSDDHFLDEREVAWSSDSWEMFDVTAAVHVQAGSGQGEVEFEVRVQRASCGSFKGGGGAGAEEGEGHADVCTSLKSNGSAILIVFSDDQRGRHPEAQVELQHMLRHEDEAIFSGGHEPRDTSDDDPSDLHTPYTTPPFDPSDLHTPYITSSYDPSDLHTPHITPPNPPSVEPQSLQMSLPDILRSFQNFLPGADLEPHPTSDTGGVSAPPHRPRRRRRQAESDYCRRTSLRVNFKDIGWHKWIVAPPEYEAYECKGTCQFPLSPDVTPSKHAIIQTLVNLRNPSKANMACCVPTKLDPITIMYQDNGVITVRHLYEEMRVAACGCR